MTFDVLCPRGAPPTTCSPTCTDRSPGSTSSSADAPVGSASMRSEFGVAPGELLAVDVPAGPAWVPLLHRLWSERVCFLLLDERLAEPERRRLLDLARPAAVMGSGGSLTVFAGASAVDEEDRVRDRDLGHGGEPRLVELSRDAVIAGLGGSRAALEAAGYDVFGPLVSCLHLPTSADCSCCCEARSQGCRSRCTSGSMPNGSRERRLRAPRSLWFPRCWRGSFGPVPTWDGSARSWSAAGARSRSPRPHRGARRAHRGDLRAHRDEWRRGLRRRAVRRHRGPDRGRRPDRGPGPTLMRGYRHDAAATGAAFDVRGWLRTGDAGAIDADGRLHVAGRLDEAIRTGAETVWPAEVERALASHPKVAEVGVAGRPHPSGVSRWSPSSSLARSTTLRRWTSSGITRARRSPDTKPREKWC